MAKILIVDENSTNASTAPRPDGPAGARTALVVVNDLASARRIQAQLEAEGFPTSGASRW